MVLIEDKDGELDTFHQQDDSHPVSTVTSYLLQATMSTLFKCGQICSNYLLPRYIWHVCKFDILYFTRSPHPFLKMIMPWLVSQTILSLAESLYFHLFSILVSITHKTVVIHLHTTDPFNHSYFCTMHYCFPLVLRHCWLADRKGIQTVKSWCRFVGGDDLTGALHVL